MEAGREFHSRFVLGIYELRCSSVFDRGMVGCRWSDVGLVDGDRSLVRKEVSRTAQDIETLCCLF